MHRQRLRDHFDGPVMAADLAQCLGELDRDVELGLVLAEFRRPEIGAGQWIGALGLGDFLGRGGRQFLGHGLLDRFDGLGFFACPAGSTCCQKDGAQQRGSIGTGISSGHFPVSGVSFHPGPCPCEGQGSVNKRAASLNLYEDRESALHAQGLHRHRRAPCRYPYCP